MDLTYNFSNTTNYDFDSDKIEFIGGVAKLKPIVIGAEAYLYAELDENAGLVARDSSGNNRDGAFQGGLDETDWTTGKINSAIEGIGATNGYINFNGVANFTKTQAFSLECWLKFTSLTTQSVMSKQKNSGNFEGYGMNLAAGKIRFVIRDSLGNVMTVETNATYNDNVFHHVVCTYDGSNNIAGLNLYIDNSLDRNVISSTALAGTIINTADLQISGRDGNNITLRTGSIPDEVVIYDRELTSAEITFRWNSGSGTQQLPGASTSFAIDNPTITPKTAIRATSLTGFAATITAAGGDAIQFTIEVNGVEKYWNGSAWVNSSGYAQSNDAATIDTNISSLTLTQLSLVIPIAYLHSFDGSTTPEIDDMQISYNFVGSVIALNEAIVYSTLYDLDGSPIANETVNVRTKTLYGDKTVIDNDYISTTTNSEGYWEISVFFEDVQPEQLQWQILGEEFWTKFLPGINKFKTLL